MKWKKWFNLFVELITKEWMFDLDQLRDAWKAGKTPDEMALANDAMSDEYAHAA